MCDWRSIRLLYKPTITSCTTDCPYPFIIYNFCYVRGYQGFWVKSKGEKINMPSGVFEYVQKSKAKIPRLPQPWGTFLFAEPRLLLLLEIATWRSVAQVTFVHDFHDIIVFCQLPEYVFPIGAIFKFWSVFKPLCFKGTSGGAMIQVPRTYPQIA